MERTTALIWSWLNVLSYKRYQALVQKFGGLDAALGELDEALLKGLGCKEETVHIVLNRLDEFDPETYVRELGKRGVEFCSVEDAAYPARLKTIPDPPVFLYYKGDLSVCDQPAIALVGTRDMSPYGQRVTEEFVPAFVRAQLTTVSGLAKGIDTVVADETLRAGGANVAVLAHGLADVQPSQNRKLAERIVAQSGVILSEYPLDTPPDHFTFVARNRIVAGLSLATVVCEAPAESGALITAALALEYNRDVFAVPGHIFDPNYEGCHALIARGHAQLAQCADDVLKTMGVVTPEKRGAAQPVQLENEAEEALWKALTTMPQGITELTEKTALPTGTVNATLTMLELRGIVKNAGAGQWVRA